MSDAKPPPDHVSPDPDAEPGVSKSNLGENIKSRSTWVRALFMILFVAIWGVTELVTVAVMVVQFLIVLFAGEKNPRLDVLGQSLATYMYHIVAYLTFVTEEQPFPFDDWPAGPPK